MIYILGNSKVSFSSSEKYDWDYNRSIVGFINLLNELKIPEKSVGIFIDREKNTEDILKQYDFMFVESVVSVNCKFDQLGVRISDILSNFIGRMLKSIEDEYIED